MMLKTVSLVAYAALVLLPGRATAQFCANTCPPLNDIGQPIPSLCNESDASIYASKTYDICHPNEPIVPNFRLEDYRDRAIVVLANFYVGCNAGRRESGVFAHVAQKYYDAYPGKVMFVSSLKGGSSCGSWANMYQRDALRLFPQSGVTPTEMPLTVYDEQSEIRDDYFTTPFGHPSYVIMDPSLKVSKSMYVVVENSKTCLSAHALYSSLLSQDPIQVCGPLLWFRNHGCLYRKHCSGLG